jgi:hypothetical protein
MIERLNAGADEPTAEIWLEEIEAQGDASTDGIKPEPGPGGGP